MEKVKRRESRSRRDLTLDYLLRHVSACVSPIDNLQLTPKDDMTKAAGITRLVVLDFIVPCPVHSIQVQAPNKHKKFQKVTRSRSKIQFMK
jgi:hypothetical protein